MPRRSTSVRRPLPPPEPKKSFRWLWWLLAVVLSCPACGTCGYLYIRSETPYSEAVALAVNDKRVQNLLGAPVSADFAFDAHTKYGRTNDDVSAIRVRLEGSERDGVLDAVGGRTSGVWGFSVLRVTAGPGRSVSLVKE